MIKTTEVRNPIAGETESGKFKHPNKIVKFRGQDLPAHFVITWNSGTEPKEGTVVGHTRFDQVLVWEQGQVVAKHQDRV